MCRHNFGVSAAECLRCAQEKIHDEITQQTKELRRMHEENQNEAENREKQHREDMAEDQAFREDLAFEQQMALDEALRESDERRKRIISEEWKLQAQAKAKEAHEQFKLGRLDAALKLATQAIEQNPANIRAFMVASWVLEKQGARQQARQLCLEQLSLLGSEKHNTNFRLIEEVLENLPIDASLQRELSRQLARSLHRWKLEDCVGLVENLIKRRLIDYPDQLMLLERNSVASARLAASILLFGSIFLDVESKHKFFEVTKRNIKYWNFFDSIILLDLMIEKGFTDEAKNTIESFTAYSIYEQLRQKEESLVFYTSWLEISTLLGNSSDQPLAEFLQRVPFTERSAILKGLQSLGQESHVIRRYTSSIWNHGGLSLSPAIVERVRSRIIERYHQWEPEIRSSLSETSRRTAASADGKRAYLKQKRSFLGSPAAFGWSVGLISAICAGLWGTTGLAIFTFFLGAPVVGLIGVLIRKIQVENAVFRKELADLTRAERLEWGGVLGGTSLPSLTNAGTVAIPSATVTGFKIRVPRLLSLTLIFAVIALASPLRHCTGPSAIDVAKYPSAACFIHDCPKCQAEPIKLERGAEKIEFTLGSCFQMVNADANMRWYASDVDDVGHVVRVEANQLKLFILPHNQGLFLRDRSGNVRFIPSTDLGDTGRVGSRRHLEYAGTGKMQVEGQ